MKRPLRILQIGKYYPPVMGGMERMLQTLSEGLVESGHDVHCWVSSQRLKRFQKEKINGVHIARTPTLGRIWSLPISFWRHEFLDQIQPDLVHLHLPNPLPLAFLNFKKVPTVATIHAPVQHAPFLRFWHDILCQKKARSFKKVIFTSDQLGVALTEKLNLRKEQAVTIPLGSSDWSKLLNSKNPGSAFDFVFVGRWVSYKGLDILLKACQEVPEARVAILGEGPLGPWLKTKIRSISKLQNVHLLGKRSDLEIAQIIAESRALVLPSKSEAEAFGLCLLEAFSLSRPVITTKLPTGVQEVNQDQKTGVHVDVNSVRGLAQAMKGFLTHPEWTEVWGENARTRYVENYSAQRMVDQHLNLYQKVLS